MNAALLNSYIRALLRLEQLYSAQTQMNQDEYFRRIETIIKPKFKQLYDSDSEFKLMDKTSVLIMLRLNLKHRIIPLHTFGLFIDLDSLI